VSDVSGSSQLESALYIHAILVAAPMSPFPSDGRAGDLRHDRSLNAHEAYKR
jgi:hypothetical protein